jgi:hypothetical protein
MTIHNKTIVRIKRKEFANPPDDLIQWKIAISVKIAPIPIMGYFISFIAQTLHRVKSGCAHSRENAKKDSD